MAKEAIQEVLAAEKEAETILLEAKKQAGEKLSRGREAYRAEAAEVLAKADQEAADLSEEYEKQARDSMQERSQAAEAEVKKIRSTDAKHIQAMSDRIVEKVLHYGHR